MSVTSYLFILLMQNDLKKVGFLSAPAHIETVIS